MEKEGIWPTIYVWEIGSCIKLSPIERTERLVQAPAGHNLAHATPSSVPHLAIKR